MKGLRKIIGVGALLAMGATTALASAAHAPHAGHQVAPASQTQQSRIEFADVTLTDQYGQERRLEGDVVADRLVVMSFVYTTCTTVCPVITAIMRQVEQQLHGDETRLVSITVDPQRDTPERLRSYAAQHGAGADWTWLTGTPQAVTETLKGLGVWSANLLDHQPVVLVGDGRSQHWTRFYGFTDPALFVAKVAELREARAVTAAHAAHH